MSLSNWESETRAVVAFAHIEQETVAAAEALRKRRRVSDGGMLDTFQSV